MNIFKNNIIHWLYSLSHILYIAWLTFRAAHSSFPFQYTHIISPYHTRTHHHWNVTYKIQYKIQYTKCVFTAKLLRYASNKQISMNDNFLTKSARCVINILSGRCLRVKSRDIFHHYHIITHTHVSKIEYDIVIIQCHCKVQLFHCTNSSY